MSFVLRFARKPEAVSFFSENMLEYILIDHNRFRVTREVSGLDRRYLTDALKSLVHSTNYRGHTHITFPIENRVVEVYSSNRVNSWRMTSWICMLFYISMLWLFTWPYIFFAEKRWAVVKVDWPFSRVTENGLRCYTTISEKDLFQKWSKILEKAILSRRQGTLTEEDLHRPNEATQDFRSGHDGIDQAVNFLGAGVRAYSEVSRQLGWGGDE